VGEIIPEYCAIRAKEGKVEGSPKPALR
jgi:hypothetical protein